MKKILIISLVLLILTGCKTPNYGADKEVTGASEIPSGTEVITYNGYVVEVTEDNMLRIKVPKRGEVIQKGITVNEGGIVKVALASVKLPTDDLPLSQESNEALKNLLLNKEVTLDSLEETAASAKGSPLNEIQGYIHLKDSEASIQEVLIENGLAIVDKSTPFIKSNMSQLENLQAAAQNNSIGVWAIDGFVNLSNSIGGQFTNIVDVNEKEIKSIIEDIKTKGLDLEKLIIK
ncbi:thermonuclease family protein [Lysinibacillus xylanilyticus]|uniref:TNase-like domain-containing protein n=1 Tax=Lysinibacillus xylanilyticus TaxID=582475 RepID=A0A2M9Q5M8_9BACI|nr:thermonuclease family protein [Lysinibacillus xylanilyticus]PJO43383.1 hypothetical protein CWD94_12585 [Lysinibacillus xylanilyticus]